MNAAAKPDSIASAQALDAVLKTTRKWSLDEAYAYCERLARSHYENFPVGSMLIPKNLRRHFHAIYAFARVADDFADEGYSAGLSCQQRLECLAAWHQMLKEAFSGRAAHPIFIALAETVATFRLPITLFEDLLSAFSQDVTTRRYQSIDDLLDYCRRSANPIGRLILLLFGYKDEQLHRLSDHICTGLQLANHWQDISIDLDKDRIYLPQDDMARFGLTVAELKQRRASESFKRLMQYEVQLARELFARGRALCLYVSGRLGLELRVVWLAGMRILERIEDNGYEVFQQRPVITAADKIRILSLAIRKGAFLSY
jgi:squalene synthase HpnC